ncbi:MCE family protein [Nocardioides sp. AE5]|uniref:MCE family protein n=1 Tax=Nocardioides sp. AE5 TaxID=2962573 RepID=UPI0028822C24|nr:MCE family protein [Nocardioides sp. AE5]MDT0202020.1 MCE family protein [Nocardioides sp. AE5]
MRGLLPGTTSQRLAAAVAVVAVVLGVLWWRSSGEEPIRVTADFADTTGLYVGNEVQYLGVPVGKVTAIEPAGTTMTVHLELDPGTEVPAEAGAVVMQSSLVTDRYVELGPVYTGGPTLASGAHIDADHTRSPANMDQIVASIDDLVLALDATTPGGKDVGDLLEVAARAMDGNGARTREAIVAGEEALRTINANGADLTALTSNLATLAEAVAARDATLRSFSASITETSTVVAGQRQSITATLAALDSLVGTVDDFVATNREVLGTDLAQVLEVTRVIRSQQASLAEAFDTAPTLAENLTRAYDQRTGRLRVQFNTDTGPLSPSFRNHMCRQLNLPSCDLLVSADGTGALDPLFDLVGGLIPGNIP